MAAQAEPRHVPSLGRLGLVLGLAALLGGCGGNVDQVDPSVAKRVVVLGDDWLVTPAPPAAGGGWHKPSPGACTPCLSITT